MQLLPCTASLPWGNGQWNSCNTPPHYGGAVGNGTRAIHCLTALGQWAVQLLQHTTSRPGCWAMQLPQYTTECLGAVDRAIVAMHCLTALGQWAVQLLQYTASLRGGSGQWNSCNTLSHGLGAVGSATLATHCLTAGVLGSATPAIHYLTAWGQWTVQLLQCTASLPWGYGQCNSCSTLPHYGGGSGQWNSCNTLSNCLGAVGSATLVMHRLKAWPLTSLIQLSSV